MFLRNMLSSLKLLKTLDLRFGDCFKILKKLKNLTLDWTGSERDYIKVYPINGCFSLIGLMQQGGQVLFKITHSSATSGYSNSDANTKFSQLGLKYILKWQTNILISSR